MSGLKSLSQELSRGSALLGAGIVGLASITACASKAYADSVADRETDVLVVGRLRRVLRSLVCAHAPRWCSSTNAGAHGNSSNATAISACAASSAQKEHGIEDSVDAYVNDMLVAGLYLNDVEKCRTIAESTNGIYEWLNDLALRGGCRRQGQNRGCPYGGHTIRRTLSGRARAPRSSGLRNEANAKGLEAECHLLLTELVKNDEGRVIGAKVEEQRDQERPTAPTGNASTSKRGKGSCWQLAALESRVADAARSEARRDG